MSAVALLAVASWALAGGVAASAVALAVVAARDGVAGGRAASAMTGELPLLGVLAVEASVLASVLLMAWMLVW